MQGCRLPYPPETAAARSAFRTGRCRTRTHRSDDRPSCPSPARGTCRRRYREGHRPASPSRSGLASVSVPQPLEPFLPLRPIASPAPTFASPKSSTFTMSSGVIFTFAGLRSRCTIPFSCAASSASAIWWATFSDVRHRHRTALQTLGQRLALDQFHHEKMLAVLIPPSRRAQRCVDGSEQRVPWLRARTVRCGRHRTPRFEQDLDRHFAAKPGVARTVHLAHAARAEDGDDVRTTRVGYRL